MFDAIGYLDEGYFMYYEEVDFCMRAARGLALRVRPRGAGGPPRRPEFGAGRSLLRSNAGLLVPVAPALFPRHLGRSRAFLADLAWALGFLSFRVRQFVQRKPDVGPPMLLRDFVRHQFLGFGR